MKCRKLLAILLALVMVIGLLPFAALADGSQDNQLDYIQGTDPDPVGDPGIDPGVDPDIQPDTDLNIDPDGEPDGNLLGDPDQDLAPGVMLLNDTHEGEEDWTALTNTTESWKLGNGKYYLDENLELGISQQIIIQGDVTLCLNGRTLKSAAAYNTGAIKVETGATLTICDCGTGGTITCSYTSQKPVIFIKGTCNLEKGTVSLTNSTLGYAILVDTDASFTMSGGTLIGGKTGIYNRGTARISGGSITGMESGIETATNPAVFHISGGTFTGDGADSSGILITNGSLNMTGGTAIGTKAGVNLRTTSTNNPEDISLAISGGTMQGQYGIYHQSDYPLELIGAPKLSTLYLASTENEVFVSKNGEAYSGERIEISLGSDASENAIVIKGVQGNANKFTYAGEDFELAADDDGNLILQVPDTAPEHENHGANGTGTITETWQPWTQATDLSSITSGYYYLTANITHDDMVIIESGADVHICLNGQTMTQSVLYVGNNASVTICDCKDNGEIIGGSTGALMLNGGSTVDFYSGTISSEATDAVNITLTTAEAPATFNMYGGTINSKKMGISNNGGIVNVYGGTILFDDYAGVFNGNDRSVATIAGGTIQPQEDAARGDNGVYVSKGTLYLTGNAKISGLKGDIKINNPNAVYASQGDAAYSGKSLSIYFSGSATETAPIILAVTNDNADLFEMVWPYKKDLVRDSNNNLVLGTKPVGHQNHSATGEGELPEGATWVAWDGTTPFSEAFPANSDDTSDLYVYLTADVTYSNVSGFVDIAPNNQAGEMRNVHLCLNGHTISGVEDGVIKVKERTSLTICDCDEQARGTIQNTSTNDSYDVITASGDVTLYSGKLISNQEGINLTYSPAVTFRMKGGSIEAGDIAIYAGNHEGGVEIVDGEIRYGGARGIFISDGTVHVSGGTIAPKEDNSNESAAGIEFTWNTFGKLYLTGDPSITGKSAALSIAKPNTVYASENGQAYSGNSLTVAFTGNDTEAPIILDVNDNNAGEFTLVSPEDKTLVRQDNNLVLGVEAPVYDHTHGVDGTNGEPVGWTAWDGMSDLAANGYYYLADNVTLTETIQVRGDVHLCLNGKTLASTADYAVEVTEDHALTICDCGEGGSIERTHESGINGGAVLVRGDFTLYGGSLENHGSKGYGIFVTVPGGGSHVTIAGGSVSSDVNAIQVGSASDVTLRGGQVSGKTSGVVLANDGISFTMTDGSVTAEKERGITTNNYDITLSISGGTIRGGDAGIRLLTTSGGGTTISGGTITSEKGVGIDQMDLSLNGWGEEVQEATLTLTGAPDIESLRLEVAGKVNGAGYTGKALDVAFVKDDAADDDIVIAGATDPAKFNLTAPEGKILVAQGGNLVLTSKPAGHKAHDANGTGEIPAGKKWIAWNGTTQMDTAGYYYLDKDITLTSTISVTKDVHLCLNGHKITVPDGSKVSAMFKIENSGKLSVCDCQEDGRIEMLRDGSNNMAIQVMSRRTFDLYSGTIYAAGSSRAVYSNSGTVNVSGGIIESPSTINGALRADGSTAVVNLSGGEIQGRLQLRSGAKLYLSNAPTLGYVDIKAINEFYPIEIHAASKDKTAPYTGGAIEISTVETNLQPGHIVVYNVNENNYQLFTLKDNKIVREGNNLVIASDDTIELTVTPPDFTYGDPDAVIEVTTVPADATVTFSRYIDDPGTLGTIDPNTGKLTGFDAGTFTVTVTATKDGYTAASKEVIFTVEKKDVTITAKNQTIDYPGGVSDIDRGTDQVTASGLVNGDVLSEIELNVSKASMTITASNAVIKNGNRDVNKNYNISYAPGTLSFSNVPQEDFAITGQPKTVTYGDTFTLNTTGGSTTGAVTWTAEGAAKVDQEGNVTITGAGDFTIKATKAGDDTYAEATATYQAAAQKKALTIAANDATIAFNAAAPAYTASVTGAMPADETAIAGAYTLSCNYAPGDAVGDYTITVTANLTPDLTAKYDLTTTNGTLHVTKTAAEVTAAPTAKTNLVYTGTAQALVTPGTATGGIMVYSLNGQDYDDAVPTGTNAGDYTVWYKVEGDGNHSDTAPVEIDVSIDKANLTVKADDKRIYEGSPAPTYTASYSGFVNNETKDVLSGKLAFTCDYTTSSQPGTYDIKPSGLTSDNYAITFQNGTLTVVAVGEILPPAAKDLTYTGKAQKLIDPAQAADDVDLFYSLDLQHFYRTIPEATNAGTYTVYWEAEKDGTTVDNGSLTVTIKKAPLTVTADDIWVYAGNTPKFTVTITGYVNGEDWHELGGKLTFTCGYSQKYSKPGSRYTITPKGLTADNYDITFKTGTLTVKDPLSPRFNVYVLDSKHGTVEADCRYARKGDVVTLTIKPDWGYELETLTVTDSHGYELKLTYHSNGTYTFTMPRDNVTVKAIFTVRDMPFVDVPGDAWHAGGVRYVYAHGLMNGTGNWRFSPNRTTTRAMIATILYRMEGSPRVYGTSQFGDVEAGSWYEDAVIWATQNDIVEGYTSKTFGPNDPITREQMAAMLYRYADYCRCDMSAGRYVDLSKFSDMDKISDYAIPALRWAVGEEIIQGRTGKRLAPTDTATRAEVAVMLMRFCEDVIW